MNKMRTEGENSPRRYIPRKGNAVRLRPPLRAKEGGRERGTGSQGQTGVKTKAL